MFDRKPPLVASARCDGHEHVLAMPYHARLPDALKSLGASFIGAKDHPAAKCWRVPISIARTLPAAVPELLRACDFKFHETASTLEAKLLRAEAAPQPGLLLHRVNVTIYPYEIENDDKSTAETGVIAMAPLHRGFNAFCVRSGGKWQPALKGFVIKDADVPAFCANLRQDLGLPASQLEVMGSVYKLQLGHATTTKRVGLSWTNAKPELIRSTDADHHTHEVLLPELPPRRAGPVPVDQVEARLSRYTLDDYQRDGARHLLRFSSSLLADDMGLGKTRQSVVAADIARCGGQVLVVCPASPLLNWKREIEMVTPGARVSIRDYDPRAQWVVTNYERLGALIENAQRFNVVIFDEAHIIKNPAAGRTRAAFTLAQRIPCRMVLTGTPLLNSISEIHTLLRLSGHPLGNPTFREFVAKWGGPDKLIDLHRELKDWMLRRDKATVLTLPGKHRSFIPYDLTPEDAAEHQRLLHDTSIEAYVKITWLRQRTELWKLDYFEHLISRLAPSDKLIVFCEYVPTIEKLLARAHNRGIGAVGISGDHSAGARQKATDAFQSDPDCRVFVGTIAVAGVAITLTAANYVLFLGMPWTWGILEQAEDRAYRRGQQRAVHVHIPIVPNGIDSHILSILDFKRDVGAKVVLGKVVESLAGYVPREAAAAS